MPAMATLTFNPLDATRRLREAGFDEKQAETMMRALLESQDRLVTTEHFDARLDKLELSINGRINTLEARLEGKITLAHWMLGIVVAGVVAIILKAYFPV
jgi:hypothetical protein